MNIIIFYTPDKVLTMVSLEDILLFVKQDKVDRTDQRKEDMLERAQQRKEDRDLIKKILEGLRSRCLANIEGC